MSRPGLLTNQIFILQEWASLDLITFRGCVTPKQISNLKETIEGNLDFLDGYDDIDEESQAKVRKALEDGHVADDDWNGVKIAPPFVYKIC